MLVASKSLVKRILAALGALDAGDGPISRLQAARRLREAAEELETAQVEAARKAGVTWIEIGECYGLTKQGAQQRFRAVRNQSAAAPAPDKKAEPAALPANVAGTPVTGTRAAAVAAREGQPPASRVRSRNLGLPAT